ncbi:hypothetical protein [Levilactobacillus spicheri]|uniref:Uncharacterized protein n=1 Tax=Levilactobacillus spicheri TaxID=216463 RepID=A0A0F3RSA4_9LACO|nr:hypothetical protein [Levilactobacillus spicheri]KJW12866.1 hypothetical protein VC81_06355 [Levilactobacillus spicheri]KJW13588.1 hypothetical protein VC81_03760 [Levilactobacillus spicheri]
MDGIDDLYEALSIYAVPVKVHPQLNILDGGKRTTMNEVVPFTHDDLVNDTEAEELLDPVVPRSSNTTLVAAMMQSLGGGGNTVPRLYTWYSDHKYREGTLVECKDHVFQVDEVGPYDNTANIYVYYLKGDDALEPV